MNDEFYMRHAAELARRALGETTPNPIVGAVIVRNGEIIGEGWHHKAGCPHAEIEAIRSANGANLEGSTIYVTLEPCSSWGRTPPCTDAVLREKFARVVIGCPDPNPKHAGRAVELLRSHGVEVTACVLEEECRKLNEAFFKWVTTGKPFVLLKLAMTLDGRIATQAGKSQWITGPDARRRVPQLRRWADAVMAVLKNAAEWETFLTGLGKRPFVSLLLEGGGELAASALNAGIVDKIEFHYAPKILGGRNSRPGVGGPDPLTLSEAFPIENMSVRQLGADIAVTGYPRKPEERRF